MLDYSVKIGLVPIRRDVTPRPGIFNWEKAEQRCAMAVSYIEEHFSSEHVSFVDLKGINAVDVLYCDRDVEAVIDRFREEKVDAVFLINGNFGNEEVAGAVAKAIGKPVLLWGPQDDVFEPDGTRYTDSQCGLFGMSRQLQRMNVPFTYIENCRIESPVFAAGFMQFAAVVCAVKNFRGLRIGQVGLRGHFLEELMEGICTDLEEIEQQMDFLDMDLPEIARYGVLSVRIDGQSPCFGGDPGENRRKMYSLRKLLEDILSKYAEGYVFERTQRELVVLTMERCEASEEQDPFARTLEIICQESFSALAMAQANAAIGIGKPVLSRYQLPLSYGLAREDTQARLIGSSNVLVHSRPGSPADQTVEKSVPSFRSSTGRI